MNKKFADMLKYLRQSRGLSQGEVAKALEIERSTYANYEQGRRQPPQEVEERIADYFNTDLNTLRGIPVPDYSIEDIEFLEVYKNLDEKRKARLLAYAQGLADAMRGD